MTGSLLTTARRANGSPLVSNSSLVSVSYWIIVLLAGSLVGVLVVNNRILLAAIILGALALVSSRLPVAWLLGGILVTRALVDGSSIGGTSLGATAGVAAMLIALGAGATVYGYRAIGVTFIAAAAIIAFNLLAVANYGTDMYREAFRCVSIVAVFYVAMNLSPTLGINRAVRIVTWVGVIPAVVTLWQWLAGTGMIIGGEIRPAGTLAHPNSAGLLFAICGLCAMYLLVEKVSILRVVTLLLFVAALLATASITSLFSFLLMFAALTILHPKISTAVRARLFLCFGALVLAVIKAPVLSTRLSGLWESNAESTSEKSLAWRLDTWMQLWSAVSDSPLVGRGLGATASGLVVKGNVPHNEYLRLVFETGAIGVLVVLFVLVWIFLKLRSLKWRGADCGGPALIVSLLVGLIISSISANTFLYSVPIYCVALLIGATFAVGVKEVNRVLIPPLESTSQPLDSKRVAVATGY